MRKILYMIISVCLCLGLWTSGYAAEADVLGGVQIHGFISQGFLNSSTYNYLANDSRGGSFQYNEMGINFGKDVTDKLHLGMQLFARDLGDAANDKIVLDWAYADYRWQDWLGLRAGRIRIPIGLFNETRDLDMLRTCIVLPQGVYTDLLRDTLVAVNGAGLYGHMPLNVLGSADYQVLVGDMSVDGDSGINKYLTSLLNGAGTPAGDFTVDTSYAAALQWNTPLEGLLFKGTILDTSARIPIDWGGLVADYVNDKTTLWVFSGQYTWKALTLTGEYLQNDNEHHVNFPVAMGGPTPKTTTTAESWYLMASYAFNNKWEMGAYYSVFYPDKDDKNGHDQPQGFDHLAWQKDTALSVKYNVNDNWCTKVEGHYVDGAGQVLAIDNPDRSEDTWYYFAAKMSFSF